MKNLVVILLLFALKAQSQSYPITQISNFTGSADTIYLSSDNDSLYRLINNEYVAFAKQKSVRWFPVSKIYGLQAALDAKATSADLSGYSETSHTHAYSDITGKPILFDGAYASLTGNPGTTVGTNLFALANPSAIRFLRINADNTVDTRSAAQMLSDIGAQASGSYLTANQSITFTPNAGGDVTGSSSGATSLTPSLVIGAGKITNSKIGDGQITYVKLNLGGNLTDADFSSGLNAAKIATAQVSNTEFNYLDGVTNPIQTQIDGKSSTSHTHAYTDITSKPTLLGYTLSVQALTSSPTDAQTIYFGNIPRAPTSTTATSKIYIRKAGTIKIAEIYCNSGTAGTNEAWAISIRLNNTTDTQIASVSLNTAERIWSNTGLSIAVAAGDYIEIKSVNPTWATNPLTTIFGGYIYIE